MYRLVWFIFLVSFFITSSSCSNSYKIEAQFGDLFEQNNIHGGIGIKILTYGKQIAYLIKNGKVSPIDHLPDPPSPSHQNSELSGDNYNFLPNSIEYEYQGPQLISPNKEFTVVSCIRKNTPPHRVDTFVLIENKSYKIINTVALEQRFVIKGIAWSPRSDIFAILTSQTIVPFQWNFVRALAGHPTNSSDYYLSFYQKNGQLLFRKEIISSLIDASVKIVWIQNNRKN
jgi:hypothetical protein